MLEINEGDYQDGRTVEFFNKCKVVTICAK